MRRLAIPAALAALLLAGGAQGQSIDPDDGGDNGEVVIADARLPDDVPPLPPATVQELLSCRPATDRAACWLKLGMTHERPYALAYRIDLMDHPAVLAAAGGEPTGARLYDRDAMNRAVWRVVKNDRAGVAPALALTPALSIEASSEDRPTGYYQSPSPLKMRLNVWSDLWELGDPDRSALSRPLSTPLLCEAARRWRRDYLALSPKERERTGGDELVVALWSCAMDREAAALERQEAETSSEAAAGMLRVRGLLRAGRVEEAWSRTRAMGPYYARSDLAAQVMASAERRGLDRITVEAALATLDGHWREALPVLARHGRIEDARSWIRSRRGAAAMVTLQAERLRLIGDGDEADQLVRAAIEKLRAEAKTDDDTQLLRFLLVDQKRYAEAFAVKSGQPIRPVLAAALRQDPDDPVLLGVLAQLNPKRQSEVLSACAATSNNEDVGEAKCAERLLAVGTVWDLLWIAGSAMDRAAIAEKPAAAAAWLDLSLRLYAAAVGKDSSIGTYPADLITAGIAQLRLEGRY